MQSRELTRWSVRELMSSPVKAVEVGTSLGEAMELLTDEHISGLVVTSTTGKAVGVVSLSDIVGHLAGLERGTIGLGGFYFQSSPLDGRQQVDPTVRTEDEDVLDRTTIEQVMTPELVGVSLDATVKDVVRTMIERSVHRVLVLDGPDGGEVVGIVSTMDVVRALDGAPPKPATEPAAGALHAPPARDPDALPLEARIHVRPRASARGA